MTCLFKEYFCVQVTKSKPEFLGMLIFSVRLLAVFFLTCSAFGSSLSEKIHNGVPLTREQLAAQYGTLEGICTPAIKIGPRVYLSAGHCPNPKLPQGVKYHAVVTKLEYPTDYNNSPACVAMAEQHQDGDTISIREANICGTGLDLRILVTDTEVPGPMVSVADHAPELQDNILVVGSCQAAPAFVKFSWFQVTDFYTDLISVTDPERLTQTCPGDSGGHYFSVNDRKEIQLVGIHTMGAWGGAQQKIAGRILKLPKYWHAGMNLQFPRIQELFYEVAREKKVEICGINRVCAANVWRFTGSEEQ